MNLRKIIRRYFWFLLAAILIACQPQKGEEVATSTITPNTISATQTLTTIQTATLLPIGPPPFPLDGYVIVFQEKGDLYFQDENSSPIQLTFNGNAYSPVISEDNENIVFYRGEALDNLYSVNADGSEEKILVTKEWVANLGEGTNLRFPTFVHDGHQVVFNTYLCETEEYYSPCSIGLYVADVDTGLIKEILPPTNFEQYDHDGNFAISPDGKLISVVVNGHIDIFDKDGEIIHRNIFSYTPSAPTELFPSQYWLPDSSGLILAIPDAVNFGWAYPVNPTYSVFLYKIDTNATEKISLSPAPVFVFPECGEVVKVSPDGDWILYGGIEGNKTSLYLGNLVNKQIQPYAAYPCPWNTDSPWSSDSKYFVYGDYFVGSFGKSPIPIGPISSSFTKWIDATHYIYQFFGDGGLKTYVGELNGEFVNIYILDSLELIKPK